MKKVFVDLRFIRPKGHSGGERYVKELAQELLETCDSIDFTFLVSTDVKTSLPDNVIKYIPEGMLTLKQHLTFTLNGYLKDADLYHYPHFDAPLYLGAPPLVATINDLHPLSLPNYTSSSKKSYFKFITGQTIQRARKIIAISEFTKQDILRYWQNAEDKIEVILDAVSDEYRKSPDDRITAAKIKYNIPDKYLFYVGNPKPHKNLGRMMKAYNMLPDDIRAKYKLVIAGVKSREELVVDASDVILPGYIADEDLPAIYSGATLFVFPSYAEGFGLPPLEAAACGVPSAVSRAASIPEVMQDNAFYFDPFDVGNIRDVIYDALLNPDKMKSVANDAKEMALSRSWRDVAKDTAKVYQEVLNTTTK